MPPGVIPPLYSQFINYIFIIMKKNIIRLLFALVALMTSTGMLAENKLWIEPFSVDEGAPTEVAIQMTNEPSAAALQFTLVLPEGLHIKDSNVEGSMQTVYRNSERLSNSQVFKCVKLDPIKTYEDGKLIETRLVYKCVVYSLGKEMFIGTEGPVAYFQAELDSDYIYPTFTGSAYLKDILMSDAAGNKLQCESTSDTDVTLHAQIAVDCESDTLYATPRAQFELPVVLNNSIKLQGLQMDIQLPEGFSMVNDFEHSDRLSNGAAISMTKNPDNTYRLVLVDLVGGDNNSNYAIRNSGVGVIFTAKINAPESFVSGSAIKVQNVIASTLYNGSDVSLKGDGASSVIVNENDALVNANAVLTGLRSSLAAALDTIASAAPDVKDKFLGEDISASIENLQKKVNEAYENHSLTPNYEEVIAPAKDIEAAIAKLVNDAKEAQVAEVKRQADNKAAYDVIVVVIADLQKQLDEAVAVIDSIYADYKDVDAITAVQAKIDAATKDSKAAFDAVVAEGVYAYKLDNEGISAEVDALVTTAKVAKEKAEAEAEAKRKADNKAAYDAACESLDSLYVHYRKVVALIQNEYKDFEDVSAELAVRNSLDAAKDDVAKAYKAVEKEGTYSFVLDVEGLTAAIGQLLIDAKEAKVAKEKAEAEAEAKRQADNKAAYDAVLEEIATIQKEFDDAVVMITAEFPEYNATAEVLAITKVLADAEKAANEAYVAVEKTGAFEYTFDAEGIRTMIAQMVDNAKMSGVDELEAEAVAENVRIFTLDGTEHARPVVGKVNVIVRKNGSVSKIMVK